MYSADVSSSEAVKVVCQSAVQEFGSVDILVNNAAIGLFQKMADSSPDDICRLWSTNVLGPIYFIQELLPFMRKQGHGHIVNISSVAGRYGIYHQGIYAATKAAIDRISEALAMEERNNGILVTTVAPDRTETDFISHALGPKELAVLPGGNLRKLTSTAVAEGIIRAIERNETIHYSSWRGYIFSLLSGALPSLVANLVGGSKQESNKAKIEGS